MRSTAEQVKQLKQAILSIKTETEAAIALWEEIPLEGPGPEIGDHYKVYAAIVRNQMAAMTHDVSGAGWMIDHWLHMATIIEAVDPNALNDAIKGKTGIARVGPDAK